MEKYFALIKNSIVQSVIVAQDDFIPLIQNDYDYIIEARPNIGDSYYSETNEFISNTDNYVEINLDTSEYPSTGTDEGFEPFNLSKYSVSYADGIVTIGCKEYPIAGLFTALNKLLLEEEHTEDCFTTLDNGFAHGKYGITKEDAQMLYNAISKVRF